MKIWKTPKDIYKYFPKKYINRLTDLNSAFFKALNIEAVVIDIDNTVIDIKKNLIDGLLDWTNELKKENINVIILSNNIDVLKVRKIANLIEVKYIFFGRKPANIGFKKAQQIAGVECDKIAVIGDQIFTDIYRCK